MVKYEVVPTKTFLKELAKLSEENQVKVLKTIDELKVNPYYPALHTKKLRSNPELNESRVNISIRVIWKFRDSTIIAMLDVGHHDVLKKY